MSVALHLLSEMVGMGLGFRLFLRTRRDHPTASHRGGVWVMLGAILGAALGAWALDAVQFAGWHTGRGPLSFFQGGRTVVGGLLGGRAGVEWAKWRVGLRQSTGDALVMPLLLGMAIGRVGCLLAGPGDQTWGGPSDLPWAIDPGDGVTRHPTPVYDMIFLALLGLSLLRARLRDGERFLVFLVCYMLWRVGVDFLMAPFVPSPAGPS